jgi:hypothetical protein
MCIKITQDGNLRIGGHRSMNSALSALSALSAQDAESVLCKIPTFSGQNSAGPFY